jgi:hypothetical protein
MPDLRAALLDLAFPEGVPPLVRSLLPVDWDPRAFGGGPVLSSTGRHRFYVADTEDRDAFTAALLDAVPAAAALLALARPGARRMVDTDGTRLDLYLDDLHLDGAGDERVMCEVLDHPSGARSRYVFLESLPDDLGHLRPLWGEGRLLRREGDRSSVLWVTEARWTGRAAQVEALANEHLAMPPGWAALRASVPGAYIDGVELHPDGRVDLTPGVLP